MRRNSLNEPAETSVALLNLYEAAQLYRIKIVSLIKISHKRD